MRTLSVVKARLALAIRHSQSRICLSVPALSAALGKGSVKSQRRIEDVFSGTRSMNGKCDGRGACDPLIEVLRSSQFVTRFAYLERFCSTRPFSTGACPGRVVVVDRGKQVSCLPA